VARQRTRSRTSRSRRRMGRTTLAATNDRELTIGVPRSRRGLSRFWRRTLTLVVVAVLAWMGWEVFRSSLFRVTRFRVTGSETVGQAEIVQAANLWDQSIFLADFGAAAERVRALPGIQDARVRGELPDCCAIEVVEREPQLVWQVAEARYWVDGEGFVLPSGENPARALVIVDSTGQPMAQGDRVDAGAVRTVQQLDRLLPTDLRPAHYEYDLQTGITMPSGTGWRACFGTDERLDAKVRVLAAILDDARGRGVTVTYIDLRPQGRPYVR